MPESNDINKEASRTKVAVASVMRTMSVTRRASTVASYALWVLNLAGLLGLIGLNNLLQEGYSELSRANSIWTLTTQRTASLTKGAREANAPVNEVFETGRLEKEFERLQSGINDIFNQIQQEKTLIELLPNTSQRNRLAFNLLQGEQQLRSMEKASLRVFSSLQSGDKRSADSAMALTDRRYGDFLDTMASRNLIIQNIQSDLFVQGEQYRTGLNQLHHIGVALLMAICVAMGIYVWRFSLQTKKASADAEDMASALRDSEERRQSLQEAGKRLIASKQQFISDAAHQIRTPIAGIKMQTERALKSTSLEEARPALLQLHAASERVVRLTNQLLTLASTEAQFQDRVKDWEIFDLGPLIREVGMRWIPKAEERGIDFGLELPDTPLLVTGSTILLEELVSNLIDNALRYCHEKGLVTLKATALPFPTLILEDSGPGIPPDERQKVFERFYRLPGTILGGAGLGLAIVRDIATLHGAEISLDEPAVGFGLLVKIVFPSSKPSAPPAPRRRASGHLIDGA